MQFSNNELNSKYEISKDVTSKAIIFFLLGFSFLFILSYGFDDNQPREIDLETECINDIQQNDFYEKLENKYDNMKTQYKEKTHELDVCQKRVALLHFEYREIKTIEQKCQIELKSSSGFFISRWNSFSNWIAVIFTWNKSLPPRQYDYYNIGEISDSNAVQHDEFINVTIISRGKGSERKWREKNWSGSFHLYDRMNNRPVYRVSFLFDVLF